MSKITLKKHSLFLLIALILLTISNTWAQEIPCIVYDDMTLNERIALGISEEEFLINKNTLSNLQMNSIVPNNYTITPKKFRINFWALRNDFSTKGADSLDFEMVLKNMEKLNNVFKDHQICFVLNGVGILKATDLLDGASTYHLMTMVK